METSVPNLKQKLVTWTRGGLRWSLRATGWIARMLFRVLVIAWGTLAMYYSNLPWGWARFVIAAIVLGLGVWALWLVRTEHRKRARLIFAGVFVVVVIWFILIPPSDNRPWRPEVSVVPHVTIDGDRVRFTGYRNFDYRSPTDFDVRFDEREVRISHLTSVDFFVSYWAIGPVGHTFVSFNFDDGPPVCVSIEARPEEDEGFPAIASMFKQLELIYVVGDERDIVRVRTNYRNEQVFLYRINTSPEGAQKLFRKYLERIQDLSERPEFYHLLKNNCTINIIDSANAAGRKGGFDISHLLNGVIDQWLYQSDAIDTTLPFAELRRRAHINAVSERGRSGAGFFPPYPCGYPRELNCGKIPRVDDIIKNTIGKALGRVVSGVYVLTVRDNASGQASAMLASWVQQAGFDPPALSIGIASDRPILRTLTENSSFALSILGENDFALMKKYARGFEPGQDPFEGVAVGQTPSGQTYLADAMAYLDCSVINILKTGTDHHLLIAKISAGATLRDGKAFMHQRGNGFHY